MSLFYTPRPYTTAEKRQAIRSVIHGSIPDRDYYVLVVGAVLLAFAGIMLDSVVVLIASMIVAPLAGPILLYSLGVAVQDSELVKRAAAMFLASVGVVLVGAFVLTHAMSAIISIQPERVILSFTPNYFFDIFIALVSGAIAAYGFIRPKVGAAMTGIGIAVSLMPPLVASSVEYALGQPELALAAFIIFILNVLGILFAATLTFASFGLAEVYQK